LLISEPAVRPRVEDREADVGVEKGTTCFLCLLGELSRLDDAPCRRHRKERHEQAAHALGGVVIRERLQNVLPRRHASEHVVHQPTQGEDVEGVGLLTAHGDVAICVCGASAPIPENRRSVDARPHRRNAKGGLGREISRHPYRLRRLYRLRAFWGGAVATVVNARVTHQGSRDGKHILDCCLGHLRRG